MQSDIRSYEWGWRAKIPLVMLVWSPYLPLLAVSWIKSATGTELVHPGTLLGYVMVATALFGPIALTWLLAPKGERAMTWALGFAGLMLIGVIESGVKLLWLLVTYILG